MIRRQRFVGRVMKLKRSGSKIGAHPPLSSVDLRWRFRCHDRRRYRRGPIVFTLKRPDPAPAFPDMLPIWRLGYERLAVLQLSEMQGALSRRQSCPWVANDRRGQAKLSSLW